MRSVACILYLVLSACGSATTTTGSGDPTAAGDSVGGGDAVSGDPVSGDSVAGDPVDPGPCGIDCNLVVPNGTGTCDETSSPARCIVELCDQGYVQLDDTVCAPPPDVSCKPCTDDSDCYGGTCANDDCVMPCDGSTCPTGYACTDIGAGVERCTPASGTCSCTAGTSGNTRACEVTNGEGTCFGFEICDPASGWVSCDAATPAAEECDGIDDDCNGLADDGVIEPVTACETTNSFGTCVGAWKCQGGAGWVCASPTPAIEECDGEDNNCDGEIDEDFKDINGYYVDDEHCGACGLTCTGAVIDGTATCVDNGGNPRCEVDQCVIGYEQVGPFTCLPAEGQLCSDCVDAGDCAVAGDECLSSAEGDYCAQDCSAGNGHGTAQGECPTGFTCTDIGGGVEQCVPDSGVCSCQAINHLETRPCEVTNGFGTCAGVETCDAASGWGVCSATPAEAEDCDGVDNDCNMLIDDALPAGGACTSTNTYGTCDGTEVCAGLSGWVCNAPDAEAEVCDHQDNNCSGQADEDFTDLYDGCSVGEGICERFGFIDCTSDGSGTECTAVAGAPDVEICDGLDNDCMGDVDEDAAWSDKGNPCTVGLGACEVTGLRICNSGNPAGATICSAVEGASGNEICNGIDDDCDGVPDNNLTDVQLCVEQDGVCVDSTARCGGVAGYLPCTGVDYGGDWQPIEISCDGLDNDCDELTDAADPDLPGRPCALQQGVCLGSLATCTTSGWATCGVAEYGGAYEVVEASCDDLDNDCDGTIDETLWPNKGDPCAVGTGACERAGLRVCNPGDPSGATICSATEGASGPESCNGIDDDCDGTPDNNFASIPPCMAQLGECSGSEQRCGGSAGWLACTGNDYSPDWEPVEITCDGLDNDCDGDTDADDPDLPANPCLNQTGVCAGSTATCNGGTWDPCGPSDYGTDYEADEGTCDNLDNDCDSITDEGWINTQGTGTYDTDTTCGNCFTDCTVIYAKPNASGRCDAAGPSCVMDCDSGFFNLNGIPDDGCEFELESDVIYVSANSGIDNGGCGLGPIATGGGRYPCASIFQGIANIGPSHSRVHVAAGLYFEDVDLANGIDLLGGFNAITWGRDIAANQTTIVGNNLGGGHNQAVRADGITSSTRFDGFTIFGENAGSGLNSYAVWVRDSTSMLEITNNTILAGNGGGGARGFSPTDGDSGAPGAPGDDCIDTTVNACSGSSGAGGAAGGNTCGSTDVDGGAGGDTSCPNNCDLTSTRGVDGLDDGGLGGGGTGGDAGNDWMLLVPCNVARTCGNPNTGLPGASGGMGEDGGPGGGCAAAVGVVSPTGHWSGNLGGDGVAATHGGGGGGGGAGGGLDVSSSCSADDDLLGGAGGGGGAGGCGGDGGGGGAPGGGAFGIFVSFSGASSDLPLIAGNTITRGNGGEGGEGGVGALGGVGGAGAAGGGVNGCATPFWLGEGGRGGEGGNGGHGGGGGGGCGGVSYAIFSYNHVPVPPWGSENTFGGGGVGGAGGVGGVSVGNWGTDGAAGLVADTNF